MVHKYLTILHLVFKNVFYVKEERLSKVRYSAWLGKPHQNQYDIHTRLQLYK